MTSFVRGIALLGFDEFAANQGLNPQQLLADCQLPGHAIDSLIPGDKFIALLELCSLRSGNSLFGLQLGLYQGAKALGSLLYVIQSANTVGEALEALIRYFHVHSSGAEISLELHGGNAQVLYDVTEGEASSARQTVELAMGMGMRVLQALLGTSWKPHELMMRHKAGGKPGAYRALLGLAPRFDSPINAWVFSSDCLKTRLNASDERFQRLLKQHFDGLAQLNVQELPTYVQKVLRSRLPSGNVTVEQLAELLTLSPRSLQRYLRAEGTSFQELLDRTRQSMAQRYICDSSISLLQLSALLGYTSLGAFSRAFTRWNGISPQKWKRQQFQAIAVLQQSRSVDLPPAQSIPLRIRPEVLQAPARPEQKPPELGGSTPQTGRKPGVATNPFVRALGLTGFEEFASGMGLNSTEMLRKVSLPREILERQDEILLYRRYCALLELCAQNSGNSLFGLQYGLFQGISVFGDLLYLIRNAGSVGEALVELRANFSLYNGAAEFGLHLNEPTAILSFRVYDSDTPGHIQAEELACGVALQLLRALVGSDWKPNALLLEHPPLGSASAYLTTLGFSPTFRANCTGLEFPASTLALPLSKADETLHQMIAAHVGKMERLTADELPSYVSQLLRNLLPSGRATVEKVADCMTLSPRTLQRSLAQEGTSFQVLLDQTRKGLARRYLDDPSISMAQLAGLLGYSDASGFSRAFNRWFDTTPLAWQKQHDIRRQPRPLRNRRSDTSL